MDTECLLIGGTFATLSSFHRASFASMVMFISKYFIRFDSIVNRNIFFFKKIYLLMAELGLRCCTQASSGCSEWATLRCGVQASHCGGFSCCGAQALGARASVAVACRLSSWGSQALEHRLSSCGAWT